MKLRKDIQGLRAFAILFVLAFHADLPVEGGFIGVDIFFVISGYVISSKLLQEIRLNGTFSLGRFYSRRFFRIFPALVSMMVFVLIASFIFLSPGEGQESITKSSIASLFSLSNLYFAHSLGGYFDLPSDSNPLLHTWSLSVEEQFYLVFPLLLLVVLRGTRRFTRKTFEIQWVIGFSVLSYISMNLFSQNFLLGVFGFYGPISRVWEFGLGIFVAMIHDKHEIKKCRLLTIISGTSLLIIIIAPFAIKSTYNFPDSSLLPVLFCVALVILFKNEDLVSKFLSLSIFQLLGKYSYSIYLWHWPFVVFSQFLFPGNSLAKLCGTFLAFFPAIVSFHTVEKRFLRVESQIPRNFLLFFSLPLLLVGSLYFVSQNGFWNSNVQTFKRAVSDVHIGRLKGCFTDTSLSSLDLKNCTWGAKQKGKPIYLLGDSNSEQFSETVIILGDLVSRPVIITAASGCPFIGGVLNFKNMSAEWNSRCNAFNSESLIFLRSAEPGLVIIGNIDSYFYQASDNISGVGLSAASLEYAGQKKIREFEGILRKTLGQLRDSGHQVMLIQTIPNWVGENQWDPAWCTTLEVVRNGCAKRMSKDDALARQGTIRKALEKFDEFPMVILVDTWEVLCPGKICSTHDKNRPYYKDGSHISVQQSSLFTDLFYFALKGS